MAEELTTHRFRPARRLCFVRNLCQSPVSSSRLLAGLIEVTTPGIVVNKSVGALAARAECWETLCLRNRINCHVRKVRSRRNWNFYPSEGGVVVRPEPFWSWK